MSRTAQAVDAEVGARVRDRRIAIGLSQTDLGEKIGTTFQQVQKYERGVNRISCSRLVAIADALETPAAHFLEGLAADHAAPQQHPLPSRFIQALPNLSGRALSAITDLAVALAEPKPEAAR